MILDRALTPEEQIKSQRCLLKYNVTLGISGAFCGYTILLLLATHLGFSNTMLSTVGTIGNACYLALPIGFYTASRFGVGKSIRNQCFLAALMCLLLAFCGYFLDNMPMLFLVFWIGLYICTSASAAMHFPLQHNITTPETLPRFLMLIAVIGTSCSLLFTFIVSFLLKIWTGVPFLCLLVCIGAGLFQISGLLITRIYEPRSLIEYAAKPLIPQVRLALQSSLVRKQILVGSILNLLMVMMNPMNVLAAKRGLQIDDDKIVLLCAFQSISMVGLNVLCRFSLERLGARRTMLITFPWFIFLQQSWWLIPADTDNFLLLLFPFAASGVMSVFNSTSLNCYFVESVPNRLQIGGTFLVFVVTGGVTGVLGMMLNPVLLRLANCFTLSNPLMEFRLFYGFCVLLFAGGIFPLLALPEIRKHRKK